MDSEILKGKKILIVEDDLSSRLYLNKVLEKTGAVLLNAGDGQQAFEIASANSDLDIILMDIQLPGLDGYSATEKIRQLGIKAIIVAQTAYGLTSDQENLVKAGFNDYFIKPIYKDKLIEKLSGFFKK
jgi:CheY-like chemotaxis protein